MKNNLCFVFILFFSCALQADTVENLYSNAQKAQEKGNIELAVRYCNQALALSPKDPELLFRIGEMLVDCKRKKEGFGVLHRVLLSHPSYERHGRMARLADKHEDFELAIEHYKACMKYSRSPEVYHHLARLFEETGKMELALSYRSQSVSLLLPSIRGLKFKEPVSMKSKNKKELESFLVGELEKEMPDEEARRTKLALEVFGLVPPGFDLKKTLTSLLTEQIGGFYNPKDKSLYLIEENKHKSFWERLAGSKRDDSEDMLVISHEMTHALQDQYFDIQNMEKGVKENDDRLLAFQALLEGDATLSMMDYQFRPKTFSREDIPSLKASFGVMSFLMPFSGGKEYANAPLILKKTLIFPYVEGLFFCLTVKDEKGFEAIDAMYSALPQSTEQILHPEKYLNREEAMDCDLEEMMSVVNKQYQVTMNNVMGELLLIVLFEQHRIPGAHRISEGWGGDRYVVLEDKNGKLSLIWLSGWDTEADAVEFFEGYRKILEKKRPQITWKEGARSFRGSHEGRNWTMEREGKKVAILENVPDEMEGPLLQKIEKISFEKRKE